MLQEEEGTWQCKSLISTKAKQTSLSLFFVQYKPLLVLLFVEGKVRMNWPAENFLSVEFRFNMWRKFALKLTVVHLLNLNNTVLSVCWTAGRKVMFCRERKWNYLCDCVSLEISLSCYSWKIKRRASSKCPVDWRSWAGSTWFDNLACCLLLQSTWKHQ